MKIKIFILLTLFLCFCLTPCLLTSEYVSGEGKTQVQVIASQCYIFEEPSFDKAVLDENNEKLVLKHGEKYELLNQESEEFVYIKYNEEINGYVYSHYVTTNVLEQDVYPVFNASVVAQETQVFDLDENPIDGLKLLNGKEVYLYEGFHKKEPMTPICFVGEDGRLVYGLVKTTDISPYGVNAGVITGLVVAASCVTIILLLVFMKKSKKIKKT